MSDAVRWVTGTQGEPPLLSPTPHYSSRPPLGTRLLAPPASRVLRPFIPPWRYNCSADSRRTRVNDCQSRPMEVSRLPLVLRRPVQPAASLGGHRSAEPVRQPSTGPGAATSDMSQLVVSPVFFLSSLAVQLLVLSFGAALRAMVGRPATRTAERLPWLIAQSISSACVQFVWIDCAPLAYLISHQQSGEAAMRKDNPRACWHTV